MDALSKISQGLGYGLYMIGMSIPIGLARSVLSIGYIVKHTLYYNDIKKIKEQKINVKIEALKQDQHESMLERKQAQRAADQEVREAVKKTKEAQGVGSFVGAKLGEWSAKLNATAVKGVNTLAQGVEDIVVDAVITTEQVKSEFSGDALFMKKEELERAEWVSQLVRGLIELIPIAGAIYYTIKDLRGRKISEVRNLQQLVNEKPGFLGYNDVATLVRYEQDMNVILKKGF